MKSTGRTLKIASAAFVFTIALSCRNRSGDDGRSSSSSGEIAPDAGGFDKVALLNAFGECALGTYKEAAASAVELDRNGDWCADL